MKRTMSIGVKYLTELYFYPSSQAKQGDQTRGADPPRRRHSGTIHRGRRGKACSDAAAAPVIEMLREYSCRGFHDKFAYDLHPERGTGDTMIISLQVSL